MEVKTDAGMVRYDGDPFTYGGLLGAFIYIDMTVLNGHPVHYGTGILDKVPVWWSPVRGEGLNASIDDGYVRHGATYNGADDTEGTSVGMVNFARVLLFSAESIIFPGS